MAKVFLGFKGMGCEFSKLLTTAIPGRGVYQMLGPRRSEGIPGGIRAGLLGIFMWLFVKSGA
jgi:hypothetical protein